jgi:cytochrome P450
MFLRMYLTRVFLLRSGAGSDTTSISMRAIIIYLGLHGDIYEQLQRDIDEFYTAKGIEALEPLTFSQTQQIALVRAVVAEAVRLVPAICGQLMRYSPGITIDKYWIPPKYTIGLSAMAVNKAPSIFGDDAEKFRPQRWLESPEAFTRLDGASMTFGSGSRGCLGKNIALVCVLQRFKIPSLCIYSHMPMLDLSPTTFNIYYSSRSNFRNLPLSSTDSSKLSLWIKKTRGRMNSS